MRAMNSRPLASESEDYTMRPRSMLTGGWLIALAIMIGQLLVPTT
jgi:hypothetical protein